MDPAVMECPSCGRLWVGYFSIAHGGFSNIEREELCGRHDAHGHSYGRSLPEWCYGTPEQVHRPDVLAAWALGGKDAAEACVNYALRDAVLQYEREHRG